MDEQRETGTDPKYVSRSDDEPEVEGHIATGPSIASDPSIASRDAGDEDADVEGHMLADPDGAKKYGDKFG